MFANEESPLYMMGGFDVMVAMLDNQPKVQAAFKSGTGVARGDQAGCMFCAVARFFRPAYHNNLVSAWLPALEGVVKRLEAGARVADVGCGHGWSTVLMAKAFPNLNSSATIFNPPLSATPPRTPKAMASPITQSLLWALAKTMRAKTSIP